MILFSIKKLLSVKTFHKKIFYYMFAIATLIMVTVFLGLFFIGGLKDIKNSNISSLSHLTDMYEVQLRMHFESLSDLGESMAQDSKRKIEKFLKENNMNFKEIADSAESCEALKNELSSVLEGISRSRCSRVFIILDTESDNNYIFNNRDEGRKKRKGIIPGIDTNPKPDERIWEDFKKENKDEYLAISGKKLFLIWKIPDKEGGMYGACGCEIDESFFRYKYVKNTDLKSFNTLLILKNTLMSGNEQNSAIGMSIGSIGIPYNAGDMNFTVKKISGNLYEYRSNNAAYVGISKDIALLNKSNSARLYVMMDKGEYGKGYYSNIIKLATLFVFILILILLVSAFISNIFIKDMNTCIEKIKDGDKEGLPLEMEEISDFFEEDRERNKKEYNEKITVLKQEVKRLEYDRKKEIDPDNFKSFIEGINTLTKTEKKIFDLYKEGYSTKELLEMLGIKESTLRYHNQNIYSKLSVNSMKLMLRYCTLMQNSSTK